jgi:hypothetical protein
MGFLKIEKKKIYIIILIIILHYSFSFAQTRLKNIANPHYLFKDSTIKVLTYNDISGSPYKFEEFKKGKIYFTSNNIPVDYELNYNAFKDELEYIEKKETKKVTNLHQIQKIEINNEVLKYTHYYEKDFIKEGFFIEIVDDYVSLYKKETTSFIPAGKTINIFKPDNKAKFIEKRPCYYISIYGNPLIQIRTKKKILRLFFNHSDLKKYLKDENIKLFCEDDLKKLIVFMNQYDKNKMYKKY